VAAGTSVLPFSRRREPRVVVRPATAQDPVARTLDEAGFGPHVARLLRYPVESPDAHVLVAASGRRLVGGACCASFGATGWIGALGVLPRARGRGVGEMLTRAAIDWLRERGAQTVLLYATEMGRPVYERVGFVPEPNARAWRGTPFSPAPEGIRRLRPEDREPMLALDRAATGEDRRPVFDQLRALLGIAYERDGELRGFALQTPWGAGPGVIAADPAAGIALLRGLVLEPQPLTITAPEDNDVAARTLAGWGFIPVNTALRMRYGPPVGQDASQVFGLFNLFWG
jgi:GNAT superfamily N-acetyltransferase